MITIRVNLPVLGEGIDRAEMAVWHVQEGQRVSEGQDLCEVLTDKVSFNVPAPCAGLLRKQLCREQQEIAVGAAIAEMDIDIDVEAQFIAPK